MKEREKPKKTFKIRYEAASPADVLDATQMFLQNVKENPWQHPSLGQETQKSIAEWLYFIMSQPNFIGVIAKHGRKSIGYTVAQILTRPIGTPKVFLFVISSWVSADHNREEVFGKMKKEIFSKAKAFGVHHWEVNLADPSLEKSLGGLRGSIDLTEGV